MNEDLQPPLPGELGRTLAGAPPQWRQDRVGLGGPALLPYREFPQGYAVLRQPEGEDGFPGELNGVRLGYVRSGGPGELKRLQSALRVPEYLPANPEAPAVVLEAAGNSVVVERPWRRWPGE